MPGLCLCSVCCAAVFRRFVALMETVIAQNGCDAQAIIFEHAIVLASPASGLRGAM